MIYAALGGHLLVVEYLVEKGADVEAKDNVNDFIICHETTHPSHMCECVRMDTLH